MKFTAYERTQQGTGASRRLRNAAKVPGIVYGAGTPQMIELDHNALFFALKKEAFHSSILEMELAGFVRPYGAVAPEEDPPVGVVVEILQRLRQFVTGRLVGAGSPLAHRGRQGVEGEVLEVEAGRMPRFAVRGSVLLRVGVQRQRRREDTAETELKGLAAVHGVR